VAEAAIRGGAEVIQWRDKQAPDEAFLETAVALRKLTRKHHTLFVVNDRLPIALKVQADGVHLGHEDLAVTQARKRAGKGMMIGRSTHSLAEAKAAERDGADYIGVGPVFSTPTKPDYPVVGTQLLTQVKVHIQIPWVAIGGIDLITLPLVLSSGATRVAVVRAIAAASDPEAAARAFCEQMSS